MRAKSSSGSLFLLKSHVSAETSRGLRSSLGWNGRLSIGSSNHSGSGVEATIHGKFDPEATLVEASPLRNGKVRPVISLPVTDRTDVWTTILAARQPRPAATGWRGNFNGGRSRAESPGHVSQSCPEKQNPSHHLSRQ